MSSPDPSESAVSGSTAAPPDHSPLTTHHSPKWVLAVSAAVMAVTMVPYLFGFSLIGVNPAFGWFSWMGYNLDDSTVYLSWIRQAADGHFFQRNLFTTEPQPAGQFNLFFLVLGLISRITTLPPIAVWHLSRIVLGILFLWAVYRLIERLLTDERSRKAAFLLICFSAGLGWIPKLWQELGQNAPVDVWQPEAITFLTLYLNPLFIVSQLLMVVFLIGLLDAGRSGSLRPAIWSGVCGFLLGNIHGYDVITLAAIWALYLIVESIRHRKLPIESLVQAAIAFIPAFLTAGYQYYLIKSNPVFAARVNVQTLSPSPLYYFLGYGLLIPIAVVGYWVLHRSSRDGDDPISNIQNPKSLLLCWLIANFAVAYLPVPFQRKMVMGLHLPICILAGAAVGTWLASAPSARWRAALGLTVLITSITNLRFLLRDMAFFQSNTAQSVIQRPYLTAAERDALQWLRGHVQPGTPIQPLPWVPAAGEGRFDTTLAAFAPGLTGLPVNAGHWGETPGFGEAIRQWTRFAAGLPPAEAADLLRRTGVRYILGSTNSGSESTVPPAYVNGSAPLLIRIAGASREDIEVFEVANPEELDRVRSSSE